MTDPSRDEPKASPADAPPPPVPAEAQAPDEVDSLRAEVERLRAATTSLEERLRREQADFVNDVRRIRREADDRVRFAAEPVVTDLLGVADALHGAIEQLGQSEHEQRVAEGLRMVEKELVDALGRHGVARIDALHKPFDPAFHQAIVEIEVADAPAARTVVQVVRPGFTLHGRVVRPAHVVVSRPASAEKAGSDEEGGAGGAPAPDRGTE